MAPHGCLLLPLMFIASARVILIVRACGDLSTSNPCDNSATVLCAGCSATSITPVLNPKDCNSYYLCKDASTFVSPDPMHCPDGDIFDSSIRNCKPDDGSCSLDCNSGDKDCFYTCENNKEGKIADPFDCSVYYQCATGVPGPADMCPANKPYFNGFDCGVDESACCHCQPYCYLGDNGKLVEDPTDCRKYFVCLEDNQVPI